MMDRQEVTFTISEETVRLLEAAVPEGQRSDFIENAIRFQLNRGDKKQFLDELISGESRHGHFLEKYNAAREMTESMNDDEFLSDSELNELDDIF